MGAARKRWAPLALAAAALGMGAPALAGTDAESPDCEAHIRGAVYPASVSQQGSPDLATFRDWLCGRDFASHDEALRAGLAHGTSVYGVRLTGGRSFSRGVRRDWKRAHCSPAHGAAEVLQAEARFRFGANREALAAYDACREVAQLDCSARVQAGIAVFEARHVESKRSVKIIGLSVNGEAVDDRQWSFGQMLGAEPRSYALELGRERKPVTFALETQGDRCEVQADPPRQRRKHNPRKRRGD